MSKRILILGSGFGGLQAAVELDRKLGSDAEILLVSEQNFLLFTPLLPQIAASGINPRHIAQTVRDIRGRRTFRFRRDTVTSIDVEGRRVETQTATLEYDFLIVALGSRADYFGIPGAREFTWNFKSLEDAVALRDHVIDLCEHADHTADPALRRAMLTVVVAGGGYTGVELITELSDFFFGYVTRRYRGIDASDIRLVLVEATDGILRGISPELAAHARHRLAKQKIEVRTGARVTRCDADGLEINGNEKIESQAVIWTAGVRATALVEGLPGQHDRIGRAVVNPFLQLDGHPEVFIVGDGAAATVAPDAPRVAPVAIAQGEVAAANIARMVRGQPLQPYNYKNQGMLVSLGMNYAVVSLAHLKFSGYAAWLFWNAVHLYKLVGLKKQLQVSGDLLLGTIFPRDALIVRRARNCKFCGKPLS